MLAAKLSLGYSDDMTTGENRTPYSGGPEVTEDSYEELSPETIERFNRTASRMAGGKGFELLWLYPEIDVLHNKRILYSAGELYWAENDEPLPAQRRHRISAVFDVESILQEGGFSRAGEEVAQAMFSQYRIDALFD
jgi:hypothetical protein